MHEPVRVRTGVLVGAVLTVVALATACTAPAAQDHHSSDDMPGMGVPMPSLSPTPTLAAAAPGGTGLAGAVGGYTFVPAAGTVPAGAPFSFQVNGPDGHAVTRYQPYLSKLLLCYVIRSDLTGFRYVDAAMRQDGVWIAQLPPLTSGSYRMYVTFATPDATQGTPLVYDLSQPFTVSGPAAASTPDSAPAASAGSPATVDGYAVTLGGSAVPGQQVPLTVTVTKAGVPVESLDRYLDGYAQVSAFREGDMARASIHTIGGIGRGGIVTTQATFPEAGTWRVYAQFQAAGAVHTAAFTMTVPG